MKDPGKQIAEAALKIEAITLSPDDPYTWASGYRMPIYNDNRKHLRYPENRQLITATFKQMIQENNIPVDFISGTSTAGIAPAASLAQALDVPIGIIDSQDESYEGLKALMHKYSPEFIKSLIDKVDSECDYDVIVSTCPHSIIPSVFLANEKMSSFAYVREKQKKHGLKQQVEGIIESGDKVLLLDFYFMNSYVERALAAIKEKGGVVRQIISKDIQNSYEPPQVEGKNVLHVEDLVSTGGSCIEEIEVWRKWKAKLKYCLAIFSYDFPETLQKFADIDCNLIAALGYEKLLSTALEMEKVKPKQHEMLKEWRADPKGWGAKHGFPKIEKGEKK